MLDARSVLATVAPFLILMLAAFTVRPPRFWFTLLLGAAAAALAFGVQAALRAMLGPHPHSIVVGLTAGYGVTVLATILAVWAGSAMARPKAGNAT